MKQNLLLISVSEPLHVGSGEGLGGIDRPIFRESTTNYPAIPGSSIKGAIKATVKAPDDEKTVFEAAFGVGETHGNQGCVAIPGAKILLFPARSIAGTFVWTTSVLPLMRLLDTLRMCSSHDCLSKLGIEGLESLEELSSLDFPDSPAAIVNQNHCQKILINKQLILEGFVLSPSNLEAAASKVERFAAWLSQVLFPDNPLMRKYFEARLVILDDNEFSYLVKHRTQVDANIRMTPKGVTDDGSLRYTEYLPAETVLFSTVNIMKPFNGVSINLAETFVRDRMFASGIAQFGGDESKGRGICRVRYCEKSLVDAGGKA